MGILPVRCADIGLFEGYMEADVHASHFQLRHNT
jgi:hypothetical protein